MSWCNTAIAGLAGIERLHSENNGDVSGVLDSLPELSWKKYWRPPTGMGHEQLGNQKAIYNLLVGKHVFIRQETKEERVTLCKIMSLVESEDIHFCQSKGKDKRCTTTFMGHTETKLGRGYNRDKTPFGNATVLELQDSLMRTNTGCSRNPTMYPLNWRGVSSPGADWTYDERRKDSTFIGEHADQKHHDIKLDGTIGEITLRSGLCYGQPFILRLQMMLVTAVPTGKTLKNGQLQYATRKQKIGQCELLVPGPMSWYIMDEIGSGRHYGWSMIDELSGKKKFVVIFHSTHRPSDPSPFTTRGVLLLDRTFDSQQASRSYFDSAILGNTPPLDFGASIALPPSIDNRDECANWIDRILQKTTVFVPPQQEKDDQKIVDILMSDSDYFERLCGLTSLTSFQIFMKANMNNFPSVPVDLCKNRWVNIKSLLLSALEEKALEGGMSKDEFALFPIAKSKGNEALSRLEAIVRSIISLDRSGDLQVSLHPEGNAGERRMHFVEALDVINNNCDSVFSKIEMLDAIKGTGHMPSGYSDEDVVRLSKDIVAEIKHLVDPHHLETQLIVDNVVSNTLVDHLSSPSDDIPIEFSNEKTKKLDNASLPKNKRKSTSSDGKKLEEKKKRPKKQKSTTTDEEKAVDQEKTKKKRKSTDIAVSTSSDGQASEVYEVIIIKPSIDSKLGLSLHHMQVTRISSESLFDNTTLEIGMIIRSINGNTYTSYLDGFNLLKNAEPGKLVIEASYPTISTELPLAINAKKYIWNENEKRLFVRGYEMYDMGLLKPLRLEGGKWHQIATFMRTRDYTQVLSYAHKNLFAL